MQAAAGPPVFKLLRDRLAVGFECFASPLNATFARFGSAFPDVDGPFGSAGSFFRWGGSLRIHSLSYTTDWAGLVLASARQGWDA